VLLVAENLGEAISKGSVQTHTNPPVGGQVFESCLNFFILYPLTLYYPLPLSSAPVEERHSLLCS